MTNTVQIKFITQQEAVLYDDKLIFRVGDDVPSNANQFAWNLPATEIKQNMITYQIP